MTRGTLARVWFALTGLVVVVGLAVQLPVAVTAPDRHFHGAAATVLNVFCYFTVQSNVLVALVSLLLARRPARTSELFRVVRLMALVGIVVTFAVYHVVLAPLHRLTGWAELANQLLHTVSPLMCLVGWVVFGPRGWADRRTAGWSLLFPACWTVFTMIRGPIVDFYPYPFIDPGQQGYLQVTVNCVLVLLVILAVTAAAVLADRALSRRYPPQPPTPTAQPAAEAAERS